LRLFGKQPAKNIYPDESFTEMGYRRSETNCIVRLLPLRNLNNRTEAQCQALRREAGRCWTEMLHAHLESRGGKWLSSNDLARQFKRRYALHSQSIQALAMKLDANVKTTRSLRKTNPNIRYPYKDKNFQTVTWRPSAIRVKDRLIRLSNGQNNSPLVRRLPPEYQDANIRMVELIWRADHYELCITIDTGQVNPPPCPTSSAAGMDLGEVNIAAVVTESGKALVVSGRALRSVKRLRNKRLAAYQSRIERCKTGSKLHKKLSRSKAKATARFTRQQRDILHKASRQVVEFCKDNETGKLAVGDVRQIQDGVNLGAKNNQKISQWPHGQFLGYVRYKTREHGISVEQIPEDYSTRTCSVCGDVLPHAPRGRNFTCPGCGSMVNRDANGAANICSRAKFGKYGEIQVSHTT